MKLYGQKICGSIIRDNIHPIEYWRDLFDFMGPTAWGYPVGYRGGYEDWLSVNDICEVV